MTQITALRPSDNSQGVAMKGLATRIGQADTPPQWGSAACRDEFNAGRKSVRQNTLRPAGRSVGVYGPVEYASIKAETQ